MPIGRRPTRAPRFALAVCFGLVLLVSGCATTRHANGSDDPFEPVNRRVYTFNRVLDRALLKPVADAYIKVTPKPVRTSVTHFFDNVTYPDVILNDFLQGQLKQGFSDAGRFIVNTTVGVLGLFDVASHVGLRPHEEDTGITLAKWGVPRGPYLMLPFFGPDTVRNTPDLLVSTVTNVLFYVGNAAITIPLSVLGVIDQRASASGEIKFMDETAVDPYVFMREAYLQHRDFLIYNGNPPMRSYDEFSLPPDDGGGQGGAAPTRKPSGDLFGTTPAAPTVSAPAP